MLPAPLSVSEVLPFGVVADVDPKAASDPVGVAADGAGAEVFDDPPMLKDDAELPVLAVVEALDPPNTDLDDAD